jgi:hypothetical protein
MAVWFPHTWRAACGIAAFLGVSMVSPAPADAATISGPSTVAPSSNGSFVLSWPAGYELRLADANFWPWTGTSYAFADMPAGTYRFRLWSCWEEWFYEGEIGQWVWFGGCEPDLTSDKLVSVYRSDDPVIDTATAEAGTVGSSADVTSRGSASISVPLRVVPGINGLQPSLAIEYDSGRGLDRHHRFIFNDSLDYGWRLSGASQIHRCRVGLAGTNFPTFSGDRFCLDGEALLAVSGTYGATNTEYRLEIQRQIKIKQLSTAGVAWFQVSYPDGRVANYGDTAASRVLASGTIIGTDTLPRCQSSRGACARS